MKYTKEVLSKRVEGYFEGNEIESILVTEDGQVFENSERGANYADSHAKRVKCEVIEIARPKGSKSSDEPKEETAAQKAAKEKKEAREALKLRADNLKVDYAPTISSAKLEEACIAAEQAIEDSAE